MESAIKPKSKLAFKELKKPIKLRREDGRVEFVSIKAYITGAENVCGYGENKSFAAADLLAEKGVHRNAILAFLKNNNLDITDVDEFLLQKTMEKLLINHPTTKIEKPPKPE